MVEDYATRSNWWWCCTESVTQIAAIQSSSIQWCVRLYSHLLFLVVWTQGNHFYFIQQLFVIGLTVVAPARSSINTTGTSTTAAGTVGGAAGGTVGGAAAGAAGNNSIVPALVPPPVALAAAPKTGSCMGNAAAAGVVDALTPAGTEQAKHKETTAFTPASAVASSTDRANKSGSGGGSKAADSSAPVPVAVNATTTTTTADSTDTNSSSLGNSSTHESDPAAYVSPCGSWKGRSVESFQWLDLTPQAKDMYIDIKYTHDFKVRGPNYMGDKKKVCCIKKKGLFLCYIYFYRLYTVFFKRYFIDI